MKVKAIHNIHGLTAGKMYTVEEETKFTYLISLGYTKVYLSKNLFTKEK